LAEWIRVAHFLAASPQGVPDFIANSLRAMPHQTHETEGSKTILWRRLDRPGHESARLYHLDSSWHLAGTAIFTHDRQPCRLDYHITCDSSWQTSSAKVAGWLGSRTIDITLSVDSARSWWLNGVECSQVAGCVDLDLNFSPSTNLLPIRRLGLADNQEAQVQAAWLRFPGFTLERLTQTYRRHTAERYRYESAGGSFSREIDVNSSGFVTRYPEFWEIEGEE